MTDSESSDWELSDHEGGDAGTRKFFAKASQALIALDVHESMFEQNQNGSYPFSNCIEACYNIVDNLIMSSRDDNLKELSIVLMEDDVTKATLVDFGAPKLDAYNMLKELKELSPNELKAKFLRKTKLDYGSFMLFCNKKLFHTKDEETIRSLVLITNDSDPVDGDKNMKFKALNEAEKMLLLEVNISVVTTQEDFEYNVFYKELAGNQQVGACCLDLEGLLEKLEEHVLPRDRKTSAKFYPFPKDITHFLIVDIKKPFRPKKLPTPFLVTKDTHESVIKAIDENEEAPIDTFEMECGGGKEKITFTPEELAKLYPNPGPLGFHLLFVSNRVSTIGLEVGEPCLLRSSAAEKRPIFKMFWSYCMEKSKVLVCKRVFSTRHMPVYVELIPVFLNGPTFIARPLVFQEDWNIIQTDEVDEDEGETEEPTERELEVAQEMVNDLTMENFDIALFIDPELEREKAYVKSEILNEPMAKIDLDLVKDEEIDEKIRHLNLFNQAAETKRAAYTSHSKGSKRTKDF